MSIIQIPKGWKDIKIILNSINGENLYKHVRGLEKINTKLACLLNDITFLRRCRSQNLTPKGMKLSLPSLPSKYKYSTDIQNAAGFLQRKIITSLIDQMYFHVRCLDKAKLSSETAIRNQIPDLSDAIFSFIQTKRELVSCKKKSIQQKKFENLKKVEQSKEANEINRLIHHVPVCVKNLSSKSLTDAEMATLSLGYNYAIPDANIKSNLLNMAIQIERSIASHPQSSSQQNDDMRGLVVHAMKSHLAKPNSIPKLPRWMTNSLRSLRTNKDLVIVKADKGNCTVLMDRVEYDAKMEDLLNTGPYSKLPSDPTRKYHEEIRKICKSLYDKKKITKSEFFSLSPGQRCPILYGVPKIHKPDIPLRPIVDYRCSPGHKISIFLKKIFKPLVKGHPNTLKNSYDFVDKIKDLQLGPTEHMVSFDVVSLFTNIPLPKTLMIIEAKLHESNDWKCHAGNLDIQDIMILTNLMTKNFFSWRNNYYSQDIGSPMGSPLSPIIAEFFLQYLESNLLPSIPFVRDWHRMVDDIFTIARKRKEMDVLLMLNNFDEQLQFTHECEENDTINFLDVGLLRKPNGSLERKVYRKPTHTNRYLDWSSYHHRSQKIAVIDSLVSRAIRICDEKNQSDELKFIVSSLKLNGFPESIINRRIAIMKTKYTSPQPQILLEEKRWVAIPFCGPLTHQIAGILRSIYSIDLGYFTGKKISRMLTNFKDKPPECKCGVYQLDCDCGSVYIGETGRDVEIRRKEHEADVRHGRTEKSAVAEHQFNNPSHKLNTGSITLLSYENQDFARKFKEALWIKKKPNNFNRNEGYELNSQWLPFLQNLI